MPGLQGLRRDDVPDHPRALQNKAWQFSELVYHNGDETTAWLTDDKGTPTFLLTTKDGKRYFLGSGSPGVAAFVKALDHALAG